MGKPQSSRKESLSENVFVVVKAEREVSKAAMVWALTHVVRPGDSITLLALLAGGNRGNSLISASPGLYIVRRNSLIDICFLKNQTCMHEEEHISLVIFLWNFCRPLHCGSSALLAILLARTVHIQRGGKLNKQASHPSL